MVSFTIHHPIEAPIRDSRIESLSRPEPSLFASIKDFLAHRLIP